MMKRDPIATELCGFVDPRSYCTPDGRHVCYGVDWKQRKKELWARCQGRCEQKVGIESWQRCRSTAAHPHHKIHKGNGGINHDDRLSNLIALCQLHHELQHPEKRTRFGDHAPYKKRGMA